MSHRCSIITFLILWVLTGSASLSAQEAVNASHREIRWLGIRTFDDSLLPQNRFLYFQGATFISSESPLPSYQEVIPNPSGKIAISAGLTNTRFEDLNPEEQSLIQNPEGIGKEVLLTLDPVYQQKKSFTNITFFPFRRDPLTGHLQRLLSFDLEISYQDDLAGDLPSRTFASHSVLSSGDWYKMGVGVTGIFRITYQDLVSFGLNPSTFDPRQVRIYGNGGGMLPEKNVEFRYDDLVENAIVVVGEEDGTFDPGDYILFYGQAPNVWKYNDILQKFTHYNHLYTNLNYYFLTTDLGPGKRVSVIPQVTEPFTHRVVRFNDYAAHDLDQRNLIKSGKVWYGEVFDIITTQDLPAFSFPNIDGDTPLRMDVDFAARANVNSTIKVYVNNGEAINAQIPPISPQYNTDYAAAFNTSKTFYLNIPTVNVRVKYLPPASDAMGWLNYVEFNVTRYLSMVGDQIPFRNITTLGEGNITEFAMGNATSQVKIWDVTNPLEPGLVTAQLTGDSLIFRSPTDSLREFIAFNGNSFHTVAAATKIPNQDLHATPEYDMIIVAHPLFMSQANELAQIHRDEGLSVFVVTPSLIYNEFSSGAQDVGAIRDFVRLLYLNATPGHEPKYLLLFGDGSYDYKGIINNNTNFVPTFQSSSSLKPTDSYVTDDFFGLMDPGEGGDAYGTLDLGVGRFPVKTTEEADYILLKIKRYMGLIPQTQGNNYSNSIPRLGEWRNMVCFVADDQDNNMHLDQAEDLSTYIDTAFDAYNIDKIYFDAYKQQSTPGGQRFPEVTADINKRMAKGALIVNYTGHGGETGWAHERVLEISDINSWNNSWDMPVFVTATCEFSRFDDPERTSAGEFVFLNPVGGGISLFTTTRLSFSSSNFALNMNFYYHVFDKIDGRPLRMGEVIMKAKTPSNPNIRNFVLLGDPALGLVCPRYSVATSSVNGNPVSSVPDTIRAFSQVTITGYIQDDNGLKINDFNGTLYPTIFDKPITVTTLGNDDESPPTTFSLQKNVLYKGKVSVVNGDFSFTFIVPRDIAYKFGAGKISYYAQNGVTDAHGSYENIIIGGSETNFEEDITGPDIQVFMNDTNFRFGGLTDQNPVLLCYVSDIHGINMVGNGIGHDIVAVLDEDTENSLVLNDYYESDLDSYQSGRIQYPFFDLSEGLHTLRVKVWDVYNNSSEAYTEFEVISNGSMYIDNLMNYPNPFIDQTSFVFNHNQPGTNLEVEIQIFSMLGEQVKTLKYDLFTEGYKAGPIRWDGRSAQGGRLNRGMYLYRLTVRNPKGETVEKNSKLIVLK